MVATMNTRVIKLLNIVFSGLAGFNYGFVLALLLAQWTWLELRFNTGLSLLVGLVVGLIIGCFRISKRPLTFMGISLLFILITEYVIAKGELSSLMILTGYVFREGALLPELSLLGANIAFGLIVIFSMLVSFLLHRFRCTECKNQI